MIQDENELWRYLELARQQLGRQYEAYGRIQSKTSILFGFGFVLLGIVGKTFSDFNYMAFMWIPVGLIFLALLLLAKAYRTSTVATAPNISLIKWHMEQNNTLLTASEDLISGMESAYQEIKSDLVKIGRNVNAAIWLILLGAGVTVTIVLTACSFSR